MCAKIDKHLDLLRVSICLCVPICLTQEAVARLRHERGKTRIDKALEIAGKYVFPYARKDVHQIAMVITDGEQTQEEDTKDLKEVSEPLRKAGVQVLALGIGSGVNPDELRLMVERDEDVLLAKNFDDLMVKVNSLIKSTCELAGKFPLFPMDKGALFLKKLWCFVGGEWKRMFDYFSSLAIVKRFHC